jgi:hypothetical protein
VIRLRRKQEPTQGQLFRAELGESVDHALRAAGYAAGGVKAAAGPAKDRARAMAQRVRYRTRAEEERKLSRRRRVSKLAGLAAIGALMGAVTAVVLRRRRRQEWEEYDPAEETTSASEPKPSEQPSHTQS